MRVLFNLLRVIMLLFTLAFFALFGIAVYFFMSYDGARNISDYSIADAKQYTFVTGKLLTVAGDASGVTFKSKTEESVKVLNHNYRVYTIQLGVKTEPEKKTDIYELHEATPTPVPDVHEQFKDYTPEYMTVLVRDDRLEEFDVLTNQKVKGRSVEFTGMVIKNPTKLDYGFLKLATRYEEDWMIKKYVCGEYAIIHIEKNELGDLMLVSGILFIAFLGISVWLGIKSQK